MNPPLPEYPAKRYALHLQQLLLAHGFVDFEGRKEVPIDNFFHPGGGAMFAVLVARDQEGDEILLKAFSGSCQGHLNLFGWVPHIVEADDYAQHLATYDASIKEWGLRSEQARGREEKIFCTAKRAEQSRKALQHYRSLYHIATINKDSFSPEEVFPHKKMPTGSGDCCAIKLLHYAFKHNLHPLSMAEFFFGAPTVGSKREHLCFYGPCDEKCKPLLHRMLGLDIVYQDSHIIIVNKDAGLLSVPGRGVEKQDSVETRIRKLFPQMPVQCAVHRLDMDTSGLLILARDKQSHRILSQQFSLQKVRKMYVALLLGVLREKAGKIILPFRLDIEHRPHQIYDAEQGKWGETHFQRIRVERWPDGQLLTRIHLYPLTGRTHQLRLHCSHEKGLGHPIKGDRLYGKGMDERLYLHAKTLAFFHPGTADWMEFSTNDPF